MGCVYFRGIECPFDREDRTFCRTDPAADAAGRVNGMLFLPDAGGRIDRTYPCTRLAPDTCIFYHGPGPVRQKVGNRTCGTFADTQAAEPALVKVDPGEIILDGRCVKGAYFYTSPAGDTADPAIFPCHRSPIP